MTSDLHRMYAIGLMAFIIFLSTLVSLPVLPRLSTELGAETYQIPIVVSAALATVVVAQFFAGALADRFSRQRLILVGTALGSVSSLLCLIASDWVHLVVLRVLGGVADAISMPALLAITSTLGKDAPGRFFGILRSSQGLSFVVGPAMGAILSLASLRAPFLVDGLLSFVAFCAAFYLIKGGERASSEHNLGVFRSLGATFGNSRVFVYLLMGFAGLFAFGIFGVFVPTKGEMLELDAWEIGLILATGSFAFSVSSYFTGVISEKVGRKLWVLASLGLLVLSGVGLVYADSLFLLIGFYVLFCLTNAVPYLLSFVYASETFDTSYIGAAMGAFDSLMDLSLLIAPLLGVVALGMTGEMAYPLLLAVLPAFFALFVIFAFLRESHAPKSTDPSHRGQSSG